MAHEIVFSGLLKETREFIKLKTEHLPPREAASLCAEVCDALSEEFYLAEQALSVPTGKKHE